MGPVTGAIHLGTSILLIARVIFLLKDFVIDRCFAFKVLQIVISVVIDHRLNS